MLEKINTKGFESISAPCKEVLSLISEMKKSGDSITVAEIGVGIGATACEIIKLLDAQDDYWLFDYEESVGELCTDLQQKDYCKARIHAIGNTMRTYDSYCWSLGKELKKFRGGYFDLVYLDGAHSFFHDGLACCLLKNMMKKNGIIVFDDIDWSYGNSPTCNPKRNPDILKHYTLEQINTCQVAMVVDIFMKDDGDWELCEEYSSNHRAAYKKIR